RPTALKVILKQSENDSTIGIKRFHREMEVMGKLSHPYVIQIYTAGMFQNNPYIAMEYVDGVPLLEYAQQLPENDFISIATLMQKILQAFSYIHSKQLVHRDVKSTNILVRPNGAPVVLDFGIAKAKDTKTLTATGTIIGSLNMAPEQARGMTRNVNHQSDIYSIGTLLYEILTKQPIVQANSFMELIKKIIFEDPILPSQWNPSIPPMLEYITLKSLEKKQQKRYTSASLMEKDLIKFLQNTNRKDHTFYLYKKQYKKHFQKIQIFSLCLIFILVGYFLFLFFPSQQSQPKKIFPEQQNVLLWESKIHNLQYQFQTKWQEYQEYLENKSTYCPLFHALAKAVDYKDIEKNKQYQTSLDELIQQKPWQEYLYFENASILTILSHQYLQLQDIENRKKYQKKAETNIRTYLKIHPYDYKSIAKFLELSLYKDNIELLQTMDKLYNIIQVSLVSNIVETKDLFYFQEECHSYLNTQHTFQWNQKIFESLFYQYIACPNDILETLLMPFFLTPEFPDKMMYFSLKIPLRQEKELQQFIELRQKIVQKTDISKQIKILLAEYFITKDIKHLSKIFAYQNKAITTLQNIFLQDQNIFFRFLAAYTLFIMCQEDTDYILTKTIQNYQNNQDSALLALIFFAKTKKMSQKDIYFYLNAMIPHQNLDIKTKALFLQYIPRSYLKYIQMYLYQQDIRIVLLALQRMLILSLDLEAKINKVKMYTVAFAKKEKNPLEGYIQDQCFIVLKEKLYPILKTKNTDQLILCFNLIQQLKLDQQKQIYQIWENEIHQMILTHSNSMLKYILLNVTKTFLEKNKYHTLANTILQQENIDDNLQVFLLSTIYDFNQVIDLLFLSNLQPYTKLLLLFQIQDQIFLRYGSFKENMPRMIKVFNALQTIEKNQNLEPYFKTFTTYISSNALNIGEIEPWKVKMLYSPDQSCQIGMILGLSSFLTEESIKVGQKPIQQLFKTANDEIQPYISYASIIFESFQNITNIPTPDIFKTTSQRLGASYGYGKVLYYDFPYYVPDWIEEDQYETVIDLLYHVLCNILDMKKRKFIRQQSHPMPTEKNIEDYIKIINYAISVANPIQKNATLKDSITLQYHLERAIIYLIASQKERNISQKKLYAKQSFDDINLVIKYDNTTQILYKYHAMILANLTMYEPSQKFNAQKKLQYAFTLKPWDYELCKVYANFAREYRLPEAEKIGLQYGHKVKNKHTTLDPDWIFTMD
ncbi:MAG TPA: serine/threonine-protein kinase, partial [Planctomycetota bacterium]|nr:serine/threonine-protein kinase [Planctomycetota bacterium]